MSSRKHQVQLKKHSDNIKVKQTLPVKINKQKWVTKVIIQSKKKLTAKQIIAILKTKIKHQNFEIIKLKHSNEQLSQNLIEESNKVTRISQLNALNETIISDKEHELKKTKSDLALTQGLVDYLKDQQFELCINNTNYVENEFEEFKHLVQKENNAQLKQQAQKSSVILKGQQQWCQNNISKVLEIIHNIKSDWDIMNTLMQKYMPQAAINDPAYQAAIAKLAIDTSELDSLHINDK